MYPFDEQRRDESRNEGHQIAAWSDSSRERIGSSESRAGARVDSQQRTSQERTGLKVARLRHWAWRLDNEGGAATHAPEDSLSRAAVVVPFVEVERPPTTVTPKPRHDDGVVWSQPRSVVCAATMRA